MIEYLVVAVAIGFAAGGVAAYGLRRTSQPYYHFSRPERLQKDLYGLSVELDATETCVVCGDLVAPANLGMFVEEDGKYRHVCSKEECLTLYGLEAAYPG